MEPPHLAMILTGLALIAIGFSSLPNAVSAGTPPLEVAAPAKAMPAGFVIIPSSWELPVQTEPEPGAETEPAPVTETEPAPEPKPEPEPSSDPVLISLQPEAGAQEIEIRMTVKGFEFNPSKIWVRRGDRVRLII